MEIPKKQQSTQIMAQHAESDSLQPSGAWYMQYGAWFSSSPQSMHLM